MCVSVLATKMSAMGKERLGVLLLQFKCREIEQAVIRSGGSLWLLPVCTAWYIGLFSCVLFRSIDRGLQGSEKGHIGVEVCVDVCVSQCSSEKASALPFPEQQRTVCLIAEGLLSGGFI